jgi:hypothetical protein
MSAQKNIEWLQHCTKQCRSAMDDMCEGIEDFDKVEKLGQGFLSTGPLEEIDIGDGITPKADICKQEHVFRAQGCYNKVA